MMGACIAVGAVILAVAFLFCGCSIEGQSVGNCTTHQTESIMAGVAWAECVRNGQSTFVSGNSTGYAQAIAPYVTSGAMLGQGVLAPIGTTLLPAPQQPVK